MEHIMTSVVVFVSRVAIGLIVIFVTWFVFDSIHDRNTEIIVSAIGLLYAFIFMVTRRLQYFGLTLFSFFGRTVSYIRDVPYDQVMQDEVGLRSGGRHLYLNAIFAALIEIICLFRLFTSLLGRGWATLSEPMHTLLHSAQF
jgi:hypothetical protein